MLLNPDRIRVSLSRLHSARPDVFGADEHRFIPSTRPSLKPPAAAFESEHNVQLPVEHRHFLTTIGNGGAGPFYGVSPFGMMDVGFGRASWIDHQGIVGKLSEPFLPGDKSTTWTKADHLNPSPLKHAIPICLIGCALRIWLVIAGEKAGHLWYDGRVEHSGLSPLTTPTAPPPPLPCGTKTG